jgi:hypothetical protein
MRLGLFSPRRLGRVALVVLANLCLLAGLIIATEGLLRWSKLVPPMLAHGAPDEALWQYDPLLGWMTVPGVRTVRPVTGPDAGDIRVNAYGFRGRTLTPSRQAHVPRVLVFGDSFVFGVGIDERHLFPAVLERLLRSRRGRPYEVGNFAVTGYSTDQELLLYQSKGRSLAPDVVILVVCDNDFLANTLDLVYRTYHKPFFEKSPTGTLVLRNVPVPRPSAGQRAAVWLARHSRLWSGLRAGSWWLQVARGRSSGQSAVELTAALVETFAAEVREAGGRLLIVNTGHRGEDIGPWRALKKRLAADGVACFGLHERLAAARAAAPERPWDFGRDAHWNVASHEKAAEIVYDILLREGMLGDSEEPATSGGHDRRPLTR